MREFWINNSQQHQVPGAAPNPVLDNAQFDLGKPNQGKTWYICHWAVLVSSGESATNTPDGTLDNELFASLSTLPIPANPITPQPTIYDVLENFRMGASRSFNPP